MNLVLISDWLTGAGYRGRTIAMIVVMLIAIDVIECAVTNVYILSVAKETLHDV